MPRKIKKECPVKTQIKTYYPEEMKPWQLVRDCFLQICSKWNLWQVVRDSKRTEFPRAVQKIHFLSMALHGHAFLPFFLTFHRFFRIWLVWRALIWRGKNSDTDIRIHTTLSSSSVHLFTPPKRKQTKRGSASSDSDDNIVRTVLVVAAASKSVKKPRGRPTR